MADTFYTILTNVGKAKIANAHALGTKVDFKVMAVGDGGGSYYNPVESQTALKNEVWRGAINQIRIDNDNPNWIVIETVLVSGIGGFTVREAGIFDADGDLIAIGKYPETYKPMLDSGSAKDLYLMMILEVTNASTVTLKVDPSVVLATRQYVDDKVATVSIPDASLTTKGKVMLSNATNGTRENVAATEKAVNDAALQAKSYTDQQISLVTETGVPKLVSYPILVTATVDNQKVFEIPLDLFDANTDTLLVAINRAVLDSTQYTVTNTVRNEAGEVMQRAKITLLSGVASTSEVTMVVLKNVPIGPDGSINGTVLAVNSVPINRVNGLQDQLDETFQAGNERKAEVVAALVAIGVQASTSETWTELIPKISAVIQATGNATVADVLAGKTFSNLTGNNLTGTMPNRGSGGTVTPGTTNQTKAAGYYSSAITIQGDPDLIAANIKSGVNIFGVTGTLVEGKKSATGSVTSSSDRMSFVNENGETSASLHYVQVTGLNFLPTKIMITLPGTTVNSTPSYPGRVIYTAEPKAYTGYSAVQVLGWAGMNYTVRLDGTQAYVLSGGFRLPANYQSENMTWHAFE